MNTAIDAIQYLTKRGFKIDDNNVIYKPKLDYIFTREYLATLGYLATLEYLINVHTYGYNSVETLGSK